MELFSLKPYRGMRICVAFSGGADSVCLLHYYFSRMTDCQISLSAIHIEHGIRGEESLRDLKFCENFCKELGIPLKIVRKDVPGLSKMTGQGLEETGRAVRYKAFSEVIESGEADFVATAHHMSDVAETVLFRLARGTALSGMRTITERNKIIRPLLHTSRALIEQYLEENNLPHVEDGTNTDEAYTRNYIRRTVLPAMEKISGNAAEHLARFSALAAADDEYLYGLAQREITVFQGDFFVPAGLPLPLFSRACLIAMKGVGIAKDYTSVHFEDIAKLRELQSGKKINLPGGADAAREYDSIVFYKPVPPIQEKPFVPEEWIVERGKLRVDLDSFPDGCVVRNRRGGDFIISFGGQKKTLKKYLTDKKISARAGKKLCLIANGSEILVIVGVEISDKVKITDRTKRVGYFT